MAHAFSEVALRSYERFISIGIDEFVRKMNGWRALEAGLSETRTFNMAYEFNCLMLDIMGGLCFGEVFGFVTGKGDKIMAQAHARAFRIYMVRFHVQCTLVKLTMSIDWSRAITQADVPRSSVLSSIVSSSQRSEQLCSRLHLPSDLQAPTR